MTNALIGASFPSAISTATIPNGQTSRRFKPRKPVTFTVGRDEQRIALVPILGSDKPARLFAEDYEALIEAGYTGNWLLNGNGKGLFYVRCHDSERIGNTATVARLILSLPKGSVVQYQDNDRLNLCRDNLVITKRKQHLARVLPGLFSPEKCEGSLNLI